MKTYPQLCAKAPCLQDEGLHKLYRIFAVHGAELRLVGGAVRNLLLNQPVEDIDCAININPAEVIKILEAHDIGHYKIGIAFGTITAIMGEKTYEITSLRQDISCDGRHAIVNYTKDWGEDAKRRDFTINALYLTISDGTLVDYVDGYTDLQQKTLRFIGKADARIAEDYLRILRYFRFLAYLPDFPEDPAILALCAQEAKQLAGLSYERIQHECFKILTTPLCARIFQLMQAHHILDIVWPPYNTQNLTCLIEQHAYHEQNRYLRLASLYPAGDLRILAVLRLKDKDRKYLKALLLSDIPPKADVLTYKTLCYQLGKTLFLDQLVLSLARHSTHTMLSPLYSQAKAWTFPPFPLSGKHVMDTLNLTPGPKIKHILQHMEDWWLAHDCPDLNACLSYLKQTFHEIA